MNARRGFREGGGGGGGFLSRNCRSGKRGICVTVVILGIVIGCALLAYTAFATTKDDTDLLQVIILFRHGDRTPTETYKNDPYLHYDWPDGWGALTKKGMLQLYNLGKWIYNTYGWLTDHRYLSNLTMVQSSYADRCLMSAQALLAGLYPPAPSDRFQSDLAWRPIPVHYTPRNADKVIVVKTPCPRLENALKEAYVNDSLASGPEMLDYFEELSKLTGQEMKTITDVEFLYNTLEIEEQNGLTLPDWSLKYYNQEMRKIAARSLAIFTSNKLQRRLRGGPLLKQIMKHMNESRDGVDKRKVHLYSVHDITLVNVLRAMGFTDELFKPDYGATLIFELRLAAGGQTHAVKTLYLNSTEVVDTHEMQVPKCEAPCTLDKLFQVWQEVLPDDWDRECLEESH